MNFVLGSNNKFFHCTVDQEISKSGQNLRFYRIFMKLDMEVFEVANNEYDVKNSKFKMGDR